MRRTFLLILLTLPMLLWRADGWAEGGPDRRTSPHTAGQAAPPAPPAPLRCEGQAAIVCQQLSELAQPAGKPERLAWPLASLAEAAGQAQGAEITASRTGSLPKPLRDMMAANRLRLDEQGRVQVFIHSEAVQAVATELERLGATVQRVADEQGLVQAWLPIDQLTTIERLPGVTFVGLPDYGVPRTGSVTTQGDTLLNVAAARSTFGFDGSGVRVGVVSDGVAGLAASQSSNDLPAVNTATCDVGSGSPTASAAGAEGTAMLEIVHDLAPGAELWFGYAGLTIDGTILDFMAAVNCLADNVDVVVDDIGWYNAGPYDGTSFVSVNATRTMEKSNRARSYLTAVGNDALSHYQGNFVDAGGAFPGLSGFHLFQRVSGTTSDAFNAGPAPANPVAMATGATACVFLQWNDPFTGSANDYDLYFFDDDRLAAGDPNALVDFSTGPQTGSQPPVEGFCYVNPGPAGFFDIIIDRFSGQTRNLDMFVLCSLCMPLPSGTFGQPELNYNTACSSVSNNSDAKPPVISVGALDGTVPPANAIEPYSSCGPTEDGRIKPEGAGVDGVDVTGNGGFPDQFFGTSAAAPHAAAIAALLVDCQPNLSPTGIRSILMSTATDLGPSGTDNRFGAGRFHALNALSATTCLVAKDGGADTDGDALLNSADPDDDNDGCLDAAETAPYALQGGRRDPHNFWDFSDVPSGGALTRDGGVTVGDLAAVVARFGSSDSGPGVFDRNSDPLSTPNAAVQPASTRQNYHPGYDRSGSIANQNQWNLQPPDGSISAGDIAAAVSQFGHSCA
ncbi:MAG: flexitail domain-containing putative surface protein [Dehalococcoidia bacterium]